MGFKCVGVGFDSHALKTETSTLILRMILQLEENVFHSKGDHLLNLFYIIMSSTCFNIVNLLIFSYFYSFISYLFFMPKRVQCMNIEPMQKENGIQKTYR
jgi:hypothetical protein